MSEGVKEKQGVSIYHDVNEYMKLIGCSESVARERCEYFRGLQEKAECCKCPNVDCQLDANECLIIDLGESSQGSWVYCQECEKTFDLGDKRIEDWINCEMAFDEVLMVSLNLTLNEREKCVGGDWNEFVSKSTSELLMK
ncbi:MULTISPECIES: hypothetical protein [Bacillus amyloliquefaciens group]|uniref:hypothetical protein n=1 Tax=Bacillus amyloliquefaciens group TaxID=1938374 RepID=UPI00073C9B17|nr:MULTISPECIES: hypothetical protein [Bacillus amyloliquefaciens group]KTF59819.1 hypothetical protein AR691_13880 [Bacillus amyloliquefaciens]